ncbi:HTH-type transcriptional regulator Hpr [Tenuibacillus multivorans]|uniref:MarR family transcriptional regulator, protease production regulatory protein HPr n=1 Tax=Tenuibacillus multivorans TaxID=237069 RepID=A0A1H0A7B2_9BACI|nr:HTH-type transcriptional regulator Hpr [Tenuibacillus multivorans]GEL78394.1 HTH-type transcriptional regulator Hpr [Tenuibacillus multivorans]SDN28646.1 MarR family transcriptional regulator, protease production regulatory protein HPr [Tenuibacillus multivorans]
MNNETYSWQEALLYNHKMAQLSKAIWKSIEKNWQEWVKPFNLNLNEHHVLWIAYYLKGATISEISKFGVMHVSTAFNFSKKLEERGLLTFSKKEVDKRNTYVKLTKDGIQLFEKTIDAHNPNNNLINASLPLKNVYGNFPEFQDLESIVKHLYGDEYLEILERSLESVRHEYKMS